MFRIKESVTELRLGHNQLQSLPNNMAVLAALERLELQHNQLTELPPGMDKLKKLRWGPRGGRGGGGRSRLCCPGQLALKCWGVACLFLVACRHVDVACNLLQDVPAWMRSLTGVGRQAAVLHDNPLGNYRRSAEGGVQAGLVIGRQNRKRKGRGTWGIRRLKA